MVDDLEDRLSRYRADIDAAVAADLADRRPASRPAEFGGVDPLLVDVDHRIGLEPTVSTPVERGRVGVIAILVAVAATLVLVAVVADRDGDDSVPANQPTTTVPSPPRALFGTSDKRLAPGTYFVDEVDGTPTARIFVTIGTGWTNDDGAGLGKWGPGGRTPESAEDDIGRITFSRPDRVYLDACHLSNGFHTGSVRTLDGLVTALTEQRGWADVTPPTDISVDGYPGRTFQRAAPVLSDCPNMLPGHMRDPEEDGPVLRSWQSSNGVGEYYEPGQFETLVVLDIDGTVVVINANLWAGSSEADRAEFAAVLDSIRIDPRPLPNVPGEPLEPGTYFVDEVNGAPTPRILATLGTGWWDRASVVGWEHIAKMDDDYPDHGAKIDNRHMIGYITFSNPIAVFKDACHPTDGLHPGPVATVDEFITAVKEQPGGWIDVTEPSDITVDGYSGKEFQRTVPALRTDCTTRNGQTPPGLASLQSWKSADGIEGGYAPGEIETLWVLDLDDTLVVISTVLSPGPSAKANADFADAVLNSIHIQRA